MRDHLHQDQEEARAVTRKTDLRLPRSLPRVDRLEVDVVSRPQKRHRRRRRRREAVRQQVQELHQAIPTGGAEARREIGYPVLCQIAGERVQEVVAPAARRGRLRLRRARADHEIVVAEEADQAYRITGMVLTVAVENQNQFARRVADAGLHRRAVALVVGMTDDSRAGVRGQPRRVVGRSVVHDDHFMPMRGAEERRRPRPRSRALRRRRESRSTWRAVQPWLKSRSMTVSQVMVLARSRPCAPSDAVSARSASSFAMASATATGSGSTTNPLSPSRTNSSVPPESRAVITGFCGQERFERGEAVVLVVRRVDQAQRVAIERDQRVIGNRAGKGDAIARAALFGGLLDELAEAAVADDDQPQMTRQVRHGAHREIDAFVLFEPRDRQHVVAVFAGRQLPAPSAADDRAASRQGRCTSAAGSTRSARSCTARGIPPASTRRAPSCDRAARRPALRCRNRCIRCRRARTRRDAGAPASTPCSGGARNRSGTSSR